MIQFSCLSRIKRTLDKNMDLCKRSAFTRVKYSNWDKYNGRLRDEKQTKSQNIDQRHEIFR